ncbi:hypothetical protein [Agrobacterium rosae]
MIALFVSAYARTPLDVIERWSPQKLLAYLAKVRELQSYLKD